MLEVYAHRRFTQYKMDAIESQFEFMQARGLNDDYEIINAHTSKFYFYKIDDAFHFLTNEHNCLNSDSKLDFYKWYEDGLCINRLSEYTKNTNIFGTVFFVSFCVRCPRYDIVNLEDECCMKVSKMNPTIHKIIVKYFYVDIHNKYIVYIRIPMICRRCVCINRLLKMHHPINHKCTSMVINGNVDHDLSCFIQKKYLHNELFTTVEYLNIYRKMTYFQAMDYMNFKRLEEPFLKKKILYYL